MNVDLHLHRVGEVDWRPKRQIPPREESVLPIAMPIREIESLLGWHAQKMGSGKAHPLETLWIPDTDETYYARLGPGLVTKYSVQEGQTFAVIERKVLAVFEPFVFIYPEKVQTSVLEMEYGTAVVVLPPPKAAIPFAIWSGNERLIEILFHWQVKLEMAESILNDLLS